MSEQPGVLPTPDGKPLCWCQYVAPGTPKRDRPDCPRHPDANK